MTRKTIKSLTIELEAAQAQIQELKNTLGHSAYSLVLAGASLAEKDKLIERLQMERDHALQQLEQKQYENPVTDTTDIETGMPKTLKYSWPDHLLSVAPMLEAMKVEPGDKCQYLRGHVYESRTIMWFDMDYYMVQDSSGNRTARKEAYEAIGWMMRRARHHGFNAIIISNKLNVWKGR